MLRILFSLLLTTSSQPCPLICSSTPCALPCLTSQCGPNFYYCDILKNCPLSCFAKIGDLNCDPLCNIPECGWDGLDCGEYCNEGCSIIHDVSNGKCDSNCLIEKCGWDGPDCKERKTEICDCSGISLENPYQYNVGDHEAIRSLTDFFNSDFCCEFIQVNLKSNTIFEVSESNKLIDSEYVKSIKIYSNIFVAVKLVGLGRLFVFGSSFVWENVLFNFENRGGKGISNFVIENNGKIILRNVQMNGDLFALVNIKQGELNVDGLEITGKLVGEYLFSSKECLGGCWFNMVNVSIHDLNMQSGVLLKTEKTAIKIFGIEVNNVKSSSNFFEFSRSFADITYAMMEDSTFDTIFKGVYMEILTISNHIYNKVETKTSLFQVKYSESCIFADIFVSKSSSSSSSALFILSGSNLSFTSLEISSSLSPAITISGDSTVSFNSLALINIFPNSAPVLTCKNSQILLSSSKIINTSTTALYLKDSSASYSTVKNTLFQNCSSEKGGAIFNSNSNLEIFDSEFTANSANSKGGAIYYDNPEIPLKTSNNLFKENFSIAGGAIFMYTGTLQNTGNTFTNNSAAFGNDFASSVYRIQAEKNFNTSHPGQVTNGCIVYTLLDYYNQTVYLDKVSLMTISIDSPTENSTIHGSQFSSSENGTFSFCDLIFLGQPDSTLTIKSELSCQELYCQSNTVEYIQVYLEPCKNGEVITESLNNCVECSTGTYSLTGNETTCNVCPNHANCYSDQILPHKGYWRSTKSSSKIFKCVNPDSCQESGICSKGYTGNLCAVCDDGYITSSSNTCKKCPSRSSNILILCFLMTLAAAIICFVIYRTYEDAYEPKLYHSVLIKILMNYFQLMTLTNLLKMRWPQPFYYFISIQEQIGSSTGKLFSIDCLIKDTSSIDPYFANQLFSTLAPFLMGFIISIVWAVIGLIINNYQRVKKPYITSLVVVFFVLHPGVSNNALSIFSCYQIESGEYWNTNSFDIQCYTTDYSKRYYGLFAFTIIFWAVGMPGVAYLMLRKNKSKLEEPSTKAKYGFLYQGYQSDRFYWEFIIMLRKILIISVTLLLRISTVSLQLIFVLIILTGALVLNLYYKPFELYELNRTENFSIILSIICFSSGLIIESEASLSLHILLFIVLVLSNFLFFCYFAKRVYQAIGHYLWSNFPNIARVICSNAQRPKIKINEILQKEERRNRKKKLTFEPLSGFVDNNKEVIIQLWNMRHFADFYNEVLAARFSGDSNIEEIERREQELVESENNQHGIDVLQTINESRPFFKRIFSRKKKMQTVQQKILNIRRQTLVENTSRRFSSDNNGE